MRLASNLRRIRQEKKLSLQELSKSSGVSSGMLSQIENNKKIPSIVIVCRMAEALGVTVSRLIGDEVLSNVEVIREDARQDLIDPQTKIVRKMLSPSVSSKEIDFIFVTMPMGTSSGIMPPHSAGLKEYISVIKGILEVRIDQHRVFVLNKGDSIYFEADVTHETVSIGDEECQYYLVAYYRPR